MPWTRRAHISQPSAGFGQMELYQLPPRAVVLVEPRPRVVEPTSHQAYSCHHTSHSVASSGTESVCVCVCVSVVCCGPCNILSLVQDGRMQLGVVSPVVVVVVVVAAVVAVVVCQFNFAMQQAPCYGSSLMLPQ